MTNRDLLKEAIADAKAVKETAIANAKAALEETFVPFLREKLALKLEEMDNEENDELKEMKKEEVEENYESKNMESSEKNEMDEEMNRVYELPYKEKSYKLVEEYDKKIRDKDEFILIEMIKNREHFWT